MPLNANRVVLVTGLSGAGKSSAMHVFEDLGYEAVDNLPLRLVPALLPGLDSGTPMPASLAIGIDTRTRGFAAEGLKAALHHLKAQPGIDARLLFLECDDDQLVRRYTETRRRHPLALDRPAIDGIRQERSLMAPLKALADEVLDTTLLAPPEFKRLLTQHYGAAEGGLTISLVSFAYRLGLPREADLVFDVRFLRNPHWVEALRGQSGLDAPVGAHVAGDPLFASFFSQLSALFLSLFEAYRTEGKSYLTIAVGCSGGRHRSVYIIERLAAVMQDAGWRITIAHRDLGR